jgi:hypothetical protein
MSNCPKCGTPVTPGARECSHCGIIFAKYAAAAASAAVGNRTLSHARALNVPPPRAGGSIVKKLLGCGCGCAVLLIVLLVGGALWGLSAFKSSASYRECERFIRQSQEIAAVTGEPMEFGFLPMGNISKNLTAGGVQGTADFTVHVSGPEGKSRVTLTLQLVDDQWEVVTAHFETGPGEFHSITRDDPAAEEQRQEEARQVATQHIDQAMAAINSEDWDAALESLDKALARDPDNAEAYRERGQVWARQDQDGMAIMDLEKAIELGLDGADIRDELGVLSYKQEDWGACVRHLDASLAAEAGNGWALEMRARCHYSRGDVDHAREDARASCDLGNADGCQTLRNLR